ncbi:LysR family transcriptional regulator [Microbacterium marinilacus]|uniref:LysR family transcriptional regulator n=1 Tax=Microbacterium marinilacus TaxID=415209 RepID=A0ABP7BUE3_9MICO|nr:LysR substrate-binding domain-containing protein [Microbacterium marinilacus]MBY0688164.1 LysR family transcriptional regulator [Microbacterium marinilacus]
MAEAWSTRRLQLLRELQLRGTITEVAAALSYSPSTVSQQLSQLEREVGVPLLQADGRRVRLTAQGEVVAAHAARVLALEEEVRGGLDVLAPSIGPVRIAALQTAARALVPRVLEILAESRPGLRVEVSVVPPETGLFEVEARGYDLAIAEQYPGHTRPHRDGLDRELLGVDPIRLAAAPGSGIAALADARHAAWVMEPEGTAARAWAMQQCRAAGFEPDVRFAAADLLAHIRLISAGHAVGLVPDLALADDAADVRLVDLPGSPHREIFTSVRASTTGSPSVTEARAALSRAFGERRVHIP